MKFSDDVRKLPRIGDAMYERLDVLGINTIGDLLTYFPREIEDRREGKSIADLSADEVNTLKARILSKPVNLRFNGKVLTKVGVYDDTGKMDMVWYNQPYLKESFHVGDEYIFVGKVKEKYNKKQMDSPIYEKVTDDGMIVTGAIVPKYPLTYKISQKILRRLMKIAFDHISPDLIIDRIPNAIRVQYNLSEYNFALHNIHFPKDEESYYLSKDRLVFEEFFITQLALTFIKHKVKAAEEGIHFKKVSMDALLKQLPFKLTGAQTRVVNEIEKDMMSSHIMNRLVQGDVGSGKTVVALSSMYIAIKNGYQAALMAPTEILAAQHFDFVKPYFEKLDMKVALLVGSTTAKNKKQIYDELKSGELNAVVGTHAILQEQVAFSRLGIAITDEQHRFGVEQRLNFSQKGLLPDILVMTATPIPRTLGLILYGDLDISIIDELPRGRQKIDTHIVDSSYYERMYGFVREEVKKGRQAYVICPMVEESEKMSELKAVTEYTQMIRENYLNGVTVEFIHGKLKPKEKSEIMERFKENHIQVLVSTTVIEVGVDNKNATIMLIENAERFGLAQLHQLRGRVGRGEHKSYCILISDSKSTVARERLKTLKDTNDGFIIAEKDLELRGVGDFFGTKQHGIPEFKIANLYEDIKILKQAQMAAADLLAEDPSLDREEHKALRSEIEKIFEYRVL